jgi:cytochrome P450
MGQYPSGRSRTVSTSQASRVSPARRLEEAVRGLIRQRRADPTSARDVLGRLTRADDEHGARSTDDELVGQTAFLFMAGHATTASALTWALLLLCAHPEVSRDLADELDGVLGGAAPDAEKLTALPLLDRVVRESLRLLPPVMWWGKVSTRALRPSGSPRWK